MRILLEQLLSINSSAADQTQSQVSVLACLSSLDVQRLTRPETDPHPPTPLWIKLLEHSQGVGNNESLLAWVTPADNQFTVVGEAADTDIQVMWTTRCHPGV